MLPAGVIKLVQTSPGIGEDGSQLKQERCNFCHSQSANPKVIESIKKYGYCILPMEGCPR
ncbi:DUF2024 family protein [Agarilytica rhodophyticola]|uniref:DUF2024 family protein n=1 Tax=Agarilytica rhodophyticola TaxID=1737490 RepID=UPI000B3466E1|nr:DUF2024 family protein [Agarilytica rhodophyticola]